MESSSGRVEHMIKILKMGESDLDPNIRCIFNDCT